jgi:MFS family permease
VAGLALAALTLGWPLAATFSGRLFYMRYGFRPTVLIGTGLVLLGLGLLVLRAQIPEVAVVAVSFFVVGLGLGLVAAPSLIAAQASVGWAERGVVTGANMFARSIGSAVGVAVFGAVANAVLDASGGPNQPSAVVDAAAAVFLAVLVAGVLTAVAALAMPPVHPPEEEPEAQGD